MQAAAGPGDGAAAAQPAGPPRTPSTRTALSPRVRAGRGRWGRVSQPPPLRAAAAPPRAGAARRARTACTAHGRDAGGRAAREHAHEREASARVGGVQPK
eukprot:1473330-Prymnesium_polylepis.1